MLVVVSSKQSLVPYRIRCVSVILPTYNERENIVALIEAIHRTIQQPHEIIVVDDHSPDGTSPAVQELIGQGSIPGLRLETRLTDRGLTKSIRRGIELARGDVLVWMDCDFSHPPEVIPSLLQVIEEGWSIAVASRYMPGGRRKSLRGSDGKESRLVILLSRFLNQLTRLLINRRYYDYTSGFIAACREAVASIPLYGSHGEYFLDLFARSVLRGVPIREVPFTNATRRAGVTKTGASLQWIARFGCRYVSLLARLWWLRVTGYGKSR